MLWSAKSSVETRWLVTKSVWEDLKPVNKNNAEWWLEKSEENEPKCEMLSSNCIMIINLATNLDVNEWGLDLLDMKTKEKKLHVSDVIFVDVVLEIREIKSVG